MSTAQRLVERSLASFAPNIAVVDGERRVTYAALAERTARLAAVFLGAGAASDRPVAIWLPNSLEFIECDVACMRAGIPRVAVGDRLTAEECAFIVGHAGAGILVTSARLLEQVRDVLPETVTLCLEVGSDVAGGYEGALARARPMTSFPVVPASSPATIVYTSGTTGRPRGATHSHGGRAAGTAGMFASELRGLDHSGVYLHIAPLSHGSGYKLVPVIASGGCSAVVRGFDGDLIAATIRAERITHTFLVPTMIRRLLSAGSGVRDSLRSLRQITFGGSPIAPRSSARRSTRSARSSRRSTARRRCHTRSRCSARGLCGARLIARCSSAGRGRAASTSRSSTNPELRRRPGTPGELLIAGASGHGRLLAR